MKKETRTNMQIAVAVAVIALLYLIEWIYR